MLEVFFYKKRRAIRLLITLYEWEQIIKEVKDFKRDFLPIYLTVEFSPRVPENALDTKSEAQRIIKFTLTDSQDFLFDRYEVAIFIDKDSLEIAKERVKKAYSYILKVSGYCSSEEIEDEIYQWRNGRTS